MSQSYIPHFFAFSKAHEFTFSKIKDQIIGSLFSNIFELGGNLSDNQMPYGVLSSA